MCDLFLWTFIAGHHLPTGGTMSWKFTWKWVMTRGLSSLLLKNPIQKLSACLHQVGHGSGLKRCLTTVTRNKEALQKTTLIWCQTLVTQNQEICFAGLKAQFWELFKHHQKPWIFWLEIASCQTAKYLFTWETVHHCLILAVTACPMLNFGATLLELLSGLLAMLAHSCAHWSWIKTLSAVKHWRSNVVRTSLKSCSAKAYFLMPELPVVGRPWFMLLHVVKCRRCWDCCLMLVPKWRQVEVDEESHSHYIWPAITILTQRS